MSTLSAFLSSKKDLLQAFSFAHVRNGIYQDLSLPIIMKIEQSSDMCPDPAETQIVEAMRSLPVIQRISFSLWS
jgi:hypothetical protein